MRGVSNIARSAPHSLSASQRLGRVVRRSALTAALIPFGAAAGIIAYDAIRRRSSSLTGTFPVTPPSETSIDETQARIYTYGEDLYADMLAAIRGAKSRVMFETYIWKNDRTGQEFKDAVEEASARGVDVYLVYDGFANLVVPRDFYRFSPAIHVVRFPVFRPGVLAFNIRKSGRDHRKILVVDDEVGFVGGYNIGDDYANRWRDTHMRITGPAVWDLRNAFVDFWNANRTALPALEDPGSDVWDPRIRVARNAPSHLVFPIRHLYLDAIDRAVTSVSITQAYFIPDREILTGLLLAASRGVDVRVIVPEVSNHVIADWLRNGIYATLLNGGVRIFLFQDAMVHAKTATIDSRWTTIGTANIDRLSLSGNYEVNVEIVDEGVARLMDTIFETDLTNCRELTPGEWNKRNVVAKLSEAMIRPLRPLL